jgi:hypothetical protein
LAQKWQISTQNKFDYCRFTPDFYLALKRNTFPEKYGARQQRYDNQPNNTQTNDTA